MVLVAFFCRAETELAFFVLKQNICFVAFWLPQFLQGRDIHGRLLYDPERHTAWRARIVCNYNIVLTCSNNSLFIFYSCAALLSSKESASHLHAVSAHFHKSDDVAICINTSCDNDRETSVFLSH